MSSIQPLWWFFFFTCYDSHNRLLAKLHFIHELSAHLWNVEDLFQLVFLQLV